MKNTTKMKLILIVYLIFFGKKALFSAGEHEREKRDIYFKQGIEYANKGMNAQSIEKFKKCILLDEQFVNAYCSLGVVYINEKMYRQALLVLEKAVELNSEEAITYYLLGKIYEKNEKYNEAIKAWEKFIILEPDSKRTIEIKERLEFLSRKIK